MVARPFGSAAQAGFGIGLRLVQAMFLPVVALGVLGRAGGRPERRRAALRSRAPDAAAPRSACTVGLMVIVARDLPVRRRAAGRRLFGRIPAVIAVGADYLRIISWGFACSGIVFVSSSIFQALGRTVPPLLTSFAAQHRGVRAGPVAGGPAGLRPARSIWYLSVATVVVHAAANFLLVQRQIRLQEARLVP